MTHRLINSAIRFAPAALLAVALWLLSRELRAISGAGLWHSLAGIEPRQWALALIATVAGYAVLTFYDLLGLRVIGSRLRWRHAARGAFLSFAVSHNVGVSWLSGGAMRQRVYGPLGLGLADVARLTVFNSVTFFVGAMLLCGLCLIAEPHILAPLVPLSADAVRLGGVALVLMVAAYFGLCARRRQPVGWGRANLPVPSPATAVQQAILSSADLILAATALFVLLPASADIGFAQLLGVYVVALGVSVLTHVPGALGVLETLILLCLPDVPREQLLAALIGYRLVYYLLPLALALTVEFGQTLTGKLKSFLGVVRASSYTVPLIAAAASFAAGIFLLMPAGEPASELRMFRALEPLPLLELSNLAASMAGLGLVILSGALCRRYDSARDVSVLLLIGGAISVAILEQSARHALPLALAAMLLLASADAFYRRGSLLRNALTPMWLGIGLSAVALSIWAGLRIYSNVAYSNELWWQFTDDGGAPRFLRASLLLSLLGLALFAQRLLGSARKRRIAEEPDNATRQLIAASPDSSANLALLGDKRFLRSASGSSFLMYQVEGRSWIVMGDPVGERSEWPGLIWSFRDQVDRSGGRPVFYEVSGESLALFADAGLVPHKIGEEAVVDLAALELGAPAAKSFRADLRRGERDGLGFEIVPPDRLAPLLPELAEVSAEWMESKHASEKGFSLGRFDPDYLLQFDCAIVRHGAEIVAFANIWRGATLSEASPDLMRHRRSAPRVTMPFLILHMMLEAKAEGFAWFNLGMAPLAGLARHRLAPRSQWIGRLVFDHGGRIYGFAGLRHFKEQFHPVWRPRYLACRPGLLPLLLSLADCTRLISRANRQPPRRPRSLLEPPHPKDPIEIPTGMALAIQ
ncbi:MAG: bifunctional lysylphosphatidylglycerol flippase/synthetase MprF [Pseudomonadota bacterium]|nr:bifunctional lysylphosphatidylglycerol flippase/synthetase MprF [Pseudomonadota bacterium]